MAPQASTDLAIAWGSLGEALGYLGGSGLLKRFGGLGSGVESGLLRVALGYLGLGGLWATSGCSGGLEGGSGLLRRFGGALGP